MANHKSAKKRAKQNEKKSLVNQMRLSKMKTEIKKFNALIRDKKFPEANAFIRKVESLIAKTAKTGALARNSASRKISTLTKKLVDLSGKK